MGPLVEKKFLRASKGAESTKEKSRQCFTHDEVSLTTQSQGVKKVGITNWKETLKNIQSETSSQPNLIYKFTTSMRLSDPTVLRFNSPTEPACIFYGRTDPAGELKCRGRFSSSTQRKVTVDAEKSDGKKIRRP